LSASPAGGEYVYSVVSGQLPTGLTLDAITGVLSGTPMGTGTFSFTISAVGTGGCTGGRSYTIVVTSPADLCTQFFDSVHAPNLPGNWLSTASGGLDRWVTSTTNPDAPMNSAFAGSAPNVGESEMVTPSFVVATGGAQMTFRNAFNFEADDRNPNIGYDGLVLEISISGGPFQDIVAAGGYFVAGGYNRTISNDFASPIAGRMAWTGLSGGTPDVPGYITTTVNLPVAANGHLAQIKWRVATDNKGNSDGDAGVRIDTIIGAACVPTAAGVEVSGRILTPDGRGLRNASVSMVDANGITRTVTSSSFGYYRLDDVEAGGTYIVRVVSRRYRFTSRVIQVFDTLSEIDFVGSN
jgi:hypothetical protein